MKVRIKRLDATLPLPTYATAGSVGFDFLAREEVRIASKSVALIPGNVVVETPPGHMLLVSLRSSAPRKKGLLKPHGIGVIDQDYCGPNDEVMIQVYNFTDEEVIVERGERVAQGIFVPVSTVEWDEVSEMDGASRGGFGSTGTH